MRDWDAPADDIFEKFRGMKKKSKRSRMMMREMKTHLIIVPDFLTAIKYISAVKKFAINNRMSYYIIKNYIEQ